MTPYSSSLIINEVYPLANGNFVKIIHEIAADIQARLGICYRYVGIQCDKTGSFSGGGIHVGRFHAHSFACENPDALCGDIDWSKYQAMKNPNAAKIDEIEAKQRALALEQSQLADELRKLKSK